ncbi:hypothetical protein ADICYQ_3639 [Cyclobacterium qasimii M12-11B]|nr:hypothetical protein ADICYQ_3639 [Cyclobacterium qasimii M12-11B]
MKLNMNIKSIASLLMMLMISFACTSDFDAINTSPTLLTKEKIQPKTIFTNVLKSSIFESFNSGNIGEFSGYFANQASGDIFSNTDYTSPFNYYRDYIINISEVVRLTADDAQKNDQNAMARIWKVWLYHWVTDAYGDIPYFEAAQGVENVINLPVYNTQEEIYIDLLNELKEAETQLGAQGDQLSFGNADILYQGNVENWKKFANSLRLRLAIRVRFADASLASEHISDVINSPLIDVNSENASLRTLPPTSSENTNNVNYIWTRELTATIPMFVGFPIMDVMIPTGDPRLPVLASPTLDGSESFRGRPIQLLQEEKVPYGHEMVASVGPLLKEETYDIIVMNAAEVFFLKAEAAFAGITGEDANQQYRLGIQASMEQYAISETDTQGFLSEEVGSLTGTQEEQFEKIVTQKYISTFFQHYQGWAEFRRTGYPRVWIGNDPGVTNGQIPRRLTYPNDEYLKNEANVKAAADRMGGNDLMTRVWWDAREGVPFTHPLQDVFPPN